MVTNMQYGQLPALCLATPGGAQAIITLYGAHLVSWQGTDGRERIFCSARSALDGTKAIRGGVPVIFPQFAARGTGMRHGFARVSQWRLTGSGVEDGATYAVFSLEPQDLAPEVAAAWPHQFALALRVALRDDALSMTFEVRNTGTQAFPFAAALHTYHLVVDLAAVRIEGVEAQALSIQDKLDKVYEQVPGAIVLESGAGRLRLEQDGFLDAVVWNPGAADTAALPDMEDDEYRRFVCIEPALLGPEVLQPGAVWRGEYRLSPAV
jgi:glucose-6-phosphate 1-epimerase